MDLRATYESIMEIQSDLQAKLEAAAFFELKKPWDLRSPPDYRVIHAMSATFTLQDYIANEIAKNESRIYEIEETISNLDPEKDLRSIQKLREEAEDLRQRNGDPEEE